MKIAFTIESVSCSDGMGSPTDLRRALAYGQLKARIWIEEFKEDGSVNKQYTLLEDGTTGEGVTTVPAINTSKLAYSILALYAEGNTKVEELKEGIAADIIAYGELAASYYTELYGVCPPEEKPKRVAVALLKQMFLWTDTETYAAKQLEEALAELKIDTTALLDFLDEERVLSSVSAVVRAAVDEWFEQQKEE